MDNKASYYIYERKYTGKNIIQKDELNKIKDYWLDIMGEDSIKYVEESYQIIFNDIISNRDYTYNNDFLDENMKKVYRTFSEKSFLHIKLNFGLNYSKSNLVFSNFYKYFLKFGIKLLEENCDYDIDNTIKKSLCKYIVERLSHICLNTLIFEMYIAKNNDQLKGISPEEEYHYYNEIYLKDSEYINSIMIIYPSLKRMIMECIYNTVGYYDSLIKRMKVNYNIIKDDLCDGNGYSKINEIDVNKSDSHRKGNTVSLISLDNGFKILYKPRSLKPEVAYQEILNIIAKKCNISMKTIKVLDCGDYGWEEFIEYKECNTRFDLKNFYYRFGILIFCHYMLCTNDLHEENIIANGEYPVIIDIETILDNIRNGVSCSAREKINEYLHESVLYSGLLPHRKFAHLGKGVDMSAIQGKEGQEYPILVPRIKEPFTSNMKIYYDYPISTKNKNLAKLNGEHIHANNFIGEIISGFEKAYIECMLNKNEILEKVNIFEDIKIRHLVQDTQKYSMILHTSYHPDFLQNGIDRNLMLCRLFRDSKYVQKSNEVVKSEIVDILNLDIPYFYRNTSTKSLFSSYDKEIKDYFSISSIEFLKNRILDLSEDDLDKQITFIKIKLTDINDVQVHESINKYSEIISLKKEQLISNDIKIKAAVELGDYIVDRAIFNSTKSEVNWIGANIIGSENNFSWELQPLSEYLYDGLSGLAIFFNALYKLKPNYKYKEIITAIDRDMFNYTNEMCQSTELLEGSSGVFNGEASIAYTYQVLYSITKDNKYIDYANRHSQIVKKMIDQDRNYDILYGNAGAIIALVNMFHITRDNTYIDVAIKAAKIIIEQQIKTGKFIGGWRTKDIQYPLTGLSHGASGIILALGKLWEVIQDNEYLKVIEKGLEFENSLFDTNSNNWIDQRIKDGKMVSDLGLSTIAWCHGAPGILLSRIKLYNILPKSYRSYLEKDIDLSIETIINKGLTGNNCLCHGNLGNTEILMESIGIKKNNIHINFVNNTRHNIAQSICNKEYVCKNDFLFGLDIYTFMTGLSGMGYSLLRDIDSSLPCILSVDI